MTRVMMARHRSKTTMTPIAPSGLKSWHAFAFLIATAVVYYYFGKVIVVIAGIVVIVRGWIWLSGRFPATMGVINTLLAALLSGGRRR